MMQHDYHRGNTQLLSRVLRVESGDHQLRFSHYDEDGQLHVETLSIVDVFEAAQRGEAQSLYPFVRPKDIQLCAAFMATDPTFAHPSYHQHNRGRKVSILFDENLPYGFVPALSRELPNLSHVYLEGMDGYSDEFIFNRPHYSLEAESKAERAKKHATNFAIITRDFDLVYLARQQWISRMRMASKPENIEFDDVNVVFRISDDTLTKLENADYYKACAKEILQCLYNGKLAGKEGEQAASYVIDKNGIHAEKGSRFSELLALAELMSTYNLPKPFRERADYKPPYFSQKLNSGLMAVNYG